MISLTSKYALRTMLQLVSQDTQEFVQVKKLALAVQVPGPYLSKILKRLVKEGFLIGRKGPGGGVKLSKKGSRASFYDICAAVSDPMLNQSCFLSRKACRVSAPCHMHQHWSKVKGTMFTFLRESRISDYKKTT